MTGTTANTTPRTTATAVTSTANGTTAVMSTTNGTTVVMPTANGTTAVMPTTNGPTTAVKPTTNGSTAVMPTGNGTTAVISTANSTVITNTTSGTSTARTFPLSNTTKVTPGINLPTFYLEGVSGGVIGVCMLAVMEAELEIHYKTKNKTTLRTTIPVSYNARAFGYCGTSERKFTIGRNSATPPINSSAGITFIFHQPTETTYALSKLLGGWYYEEPFFDKDAVMYGKLGTLEMDMNLLSGTVGKTYKCHEVGYSWTIKETGMEGVFVFKKLIMFQPYADFSKDKGSFGEVEDCDRPKTTGMPPSTAFPTTRFLPTKPSSINVGMIVGIVVGTFALAVIVIGLACYFVRRAKKKKEVHVPYDQIVNSSVPKL
ncbi:uncharacterized protein LOC119725015 [Patiria miniata]|uniref:Uncharacterized protein n=1 Tax=Patiria miniata TaxID=46514 RepID=A0A913ZKI8_PATMI|nr:uncharacterized protein LOC119725015 [Patiria miniata]